MAAGSPLWRGTGGKSELRRVSVVGNAHRPPPLLLTFVSKKVVGGRIRATETTTHQKGPDPFWQRVKRGNLYAEKGQIGEDARLPR